MSDTEQRGSDQSPSSSTSPSDVHPPASAGDRQEAILFHLQDDPIRTFLERIDYDRMIVEIAHHFSVNPATVVDAYEVNTPLVGLPPDAVPVIAHLFPDIAVGQNAKLVVFDVEVHGYTPEPHFRMGPAARCFVLPVPEWVDRNAILILANVDLYCNAEWEVLDVAGRLQMAGLRPTAHTRGSWGLHPNSTAPIV